MFHPIPASSGSEESDEDLSVAVHDIIIVSGGQNSEREDTSLDDDSTSRSTSDAIQSPLRKRPRSDSSGRGFSDDDSSNSSEEQSGDSSDESRYESDNESVERNGTKRQQSRRTPTKKPRAAPTDGYKPQFQEKGTGKRFIQTLTLRHALQIMDEEAKLTTRSVAQRLLEEGNKDASKMIQVRSGQHAKAILNKVREQLRESKIPDQYVRLEDLDVTDLGMTNDHRRAEVRANQQLSRQLRKRRIVLQTDVDDALAERNRVHQDYKNLREEETKCHPLLAEKMRGPNVSLAHQDSTQRTANAQKRPTGPSLHEFLRRLPSP